MKNSMLKCGTVLMLATMAVSATAPTVHAAEANKKAKITKVAKAKATKEEAKENYTTLASVGSISGQVDSGIVDFPILYVNNGDLEKGATPLFGTAIEIDSLVNDKTIGKEVTIDFGVVGDMKIKTDSEYTKLSVEGITPEDGKFTREVKDVKVDKDGHLTGKIKVEKGMTQLLAIFELSDFGRDKLDLGFGHKDSKLITLKVSEGENVVAHQVLNNIEVVSSADSKVIKEATDKYKDNVPKLRAELNNVFLAGQSSEGNDTDKPGTGEGNGSGTEGNGNGSEGNGSGTEGNGNGSGNGSGTEGNGNGSGNGSGTEGNGSGNGSGTTGNGSGSGSGTTGNGNGSGITGNGNGSGTTGNGNGSGTTGNGNGSTTDTSKEATEQQAIKDARTDARKAALEGEKRLVDETKLMGKTTPYRTAYEKEFYSVYDKTQTAMVEAFLAGYKEGYADQKANKTGADPDKRAPYATDFGPSFDAGYKTGQQDAKDGKESRDVYFTNNPNAALDIIYGAAGKTNPNATTNATTNGTKSESDPQTGVETHQNAGLIAGLLAAVGLGSGLVFFKSRKKS